MQRHRAGALAEVLLGQTEAIWVFPLRSVHRHSFVQAALLGNVCLDLSLSGLCQNQSGTQRKDASALSTNLLAVLSG